VNVPLAGVHMFGSTTRPSSTLWGIGDTFVRSKIAYPAVRTASPRLGVSPTT
jgi:hypothetical protein